MAIPFNVNVPCLKNVYHFSFHNDERSHSPVLNITNRPPAIMAVMATAALTAASPSASAIA